MKHTIELKKSTSGLWLGKLEQPFSDGDTVEFISSKGSINCLVKRSTGSVCDTCPMHLNFCTDRSSCDLLIRTLYGDRDSCNPCNNKLAVWGSEEDRDFDIVYVSLESLLEGL